MIERVSDKKNRAAALHCPIVASALHRLARFLADKKWRVNKKMGADL